jgi:hypothetical protein
MPRRCIGDVVLKLHSFHTSAIRGVELSIKDILKPAFYHVSWHRTHVGVQDGTVQYETPCPQRWLSLRFTFPHTVLRIEVRASLQFHAKFPMTTVPGEMCIHQGPFLLEPCKKGHAIVSCYSICVLCRRGCLWCAYRVERRLGVLAEDNISARVENGYPSLPFPSNCTDFTVGARSTVVTKSLGMLVGRYLYPTLHSPKKCCDMTPESRNSPLLDNGSLTHVLWRCGFVETDLVRNALSMSTGSTNHFHGYAWATNIFNGYVLDCKSGNTKKMQP